MTNKVHDANLILLLFLNFKEVGNLSLITFCHMKQLTPISKSLHFQCVKFLLNGQMFYVLLTNEHSLTCFQNDGFVLFSET